MRGAFSGVLARYGREVTLFPKEGGAPVICRAFLQPVAEKKERGRQFLPGVLGTAREERFLYLGDGACSLLETACLRCEGEDYDILSAQQVFLGREVSHWRGVLRRREEAGEL